MPTDFGRPFKPVYIPYIFFFLDTPSQFEMGMSLLYKAEHLILSGKDLFHYSSSDLQTIL